MVERLKWFTVLLWYLILLYYLLVSYLKWYAFLYMKKVAFIFFKRKLNKKCFRFENSGQRYKKKTRNWMRNIFCKEYVKWNCIKFQILNWGLFWKKLYISTVETRFHISRFLRHFLFKLPQMFNITNVIKPYILRYKT